MEKDIMCKVAVLLGKVMAHSGSVVRDPKEVSPDGDVTFRIDLSEFGVEVGEARVCLGDETVRAYVANLLGEWMIRRHIREFQPLAEDAGFSELADKFAHKAFGARFAAKSPSQLEFTFHLSLLRKILNEGSPKSGKTVATRAKSPAEVDAWGGKRAKPSRDFLGWLAHVPLLRPNQMSDLLGECGYVGQDEARRAVCLMAYRHISRLRRVYLDGVERAALPAKDNLLMMGPTGCGKTHLVELLFGRILQIPHVVVDLTTFTEAGYVGDDVPTILTRLVQSVGGDVERASVGVLCLDEFDKVAGDQSAGTSGGRGRDVTGYGVQRELLKMLESAEVCVPTEMSKAFQAKRIPLNTADIPFVACGAFTGLSPSGGYRRSQAPIGFGANGIVRTREVQGFGGEDASSVAGFVSYGLMPELMGRFTRIVSLRAIEADQLKAILRGNVIARYRKELEMAGIDLKIGSAVYDRVVAECVKRGTGARGLGLILYNRLEEACFEAYSNPGKVRRVDLDVEGDELRCRVA